MSQGKQLLMKVQMMVIDHLGIRLYSHLAPVMCELIANSWDADAKNVHIRVPEGPIDESSEITINDDGMGMAFDEINECYLQIGRNRRLAGEDITPRGRKVLGRKGLGKLSAFGVAEELEVSTVKNGRRISFIMNVQKLRLQRTGEYPLPYEDGVTSDSNGTTLTLRVLKRKSPIDIEALRRQIARRFTILDNDFGVYLNGAEITLDDCDYDLEYKWDVDEWVDEGETRRVTGWIGTLASPVRGDFGKGIIVTTRGKLVQEPTFFGVSGGKQVAYAYMVGVIEADYLDEDPERDLTTTARSGLVSDAEEVQELFAWARKKVIGVSEEWADKRIEKKENKITGLPGVKGWMQGLGKIEQRIAGKVVRAIASVPDLPQDKAEEYLDYVMDSIEHRAFRELVDAFKGTEDEVMLLHLFREWEVLEAKEMLRVTEGRLATIEKFAGFVREDAKEVPTLHNFFREFPWMLDPRWTVWKDEVSYSTLLKEHFPENEDVPEKNRRIDFLAVGFGTTLNVIELKRPGIRISKGELQQAQDYLEFIQTHVRDEGRFADAKAYLVCGDMVDKAVVRTKRENLRKMGVEVLFYSELLDRTQRWHQELIDKYTILKARKPDDHTASQGEAAAAGEDEPS